MSTLTHSVTVSERFPLPQAVVVETRHVAGTHPPAAHRARFPRERALAKCRCASTPNFLLCTLRAANKCDDFAAGTVLLPVDCS